MAHLNIGYHWGDQRGSVWGDVGVRVPGRWGVGGEGGGGHILNSVIGI